MEPDDLLAGLDAHQRAAVVTPSTLVAVIASAGSGKTRVLTRRIAYRIAAGTADARHTLALTFTREAAGELRRRLRRSGLREPVEAGTFHSIALGLLRQRWSDTDRRPPTIVSDPQRLMAEVAGAVPLEVLAAEHDWTAARGVRAAAYAAAARQAGRRSPAPVERVAEALAAYEDEKRRRGVVDLDDLLTMVTDEAASDAEFAETLRWRFRHVLVDEAQDLNPVQYRLLGLLAGARRDLYLVGDPAQAIYGFNGADPTLLDDVDRHLPGIEVVRLPINHRCPPEVVAAGRRPLEVSGQRTDAVSGREPGGPIEFVVGADEHDEADRVAGLVAACPPRLVRDGHVAVLARTHQQLTLMRRALEARGIPCQRDPVAAGTPLAAVLRRVTGLPSPSRLRAWAHDVIDAPPDPSGTPRDDDATAEHRVALVVLDFLREQPLGDGVGFRGWVLSTSPFNDEGDHLGVELLTFHAAKGREWPTVVVTGAETGLVPHRSATTVEGRAEEARLLHVALTRAEERLVITRAARRRGYARQASPLLAGIHDVLGALDGPAPPVAAPAPIDAYADHGRDERERAITLAAWRAQTARAGALLPGQICSDDDLAAIVAALPRSAAELSAVTSFGPVTAARHFDAIRAALDTVPAASP